MCAMRHASQIPSTKDSCLKISPEKNPGDVPFGPGDVVNGNVSLKQQDLNELVWKSKSSPGWNASISNATLLDVRLLGQICIALCRQSHRKQNYGNHSGSLSNFDPDADNVKLFESSSTCYECSMNATSDMSWRFALPIPSSSLAGEPLPPTFGAEFARHLGEKWNIRVQYKIYARVTIGSTTLSGVLPIQVVPFTTAVRVDRHESLGSLDIQGRSLITLRPELLNTLQTVSSFPCEALAGQPITCGLTIQHPEHSRDSSRPGSSQSSIRLLSWHLELESTTRASVNGVTRTHVSVILSRKRNNNAMLQIDSSGKAVFMTDEILIPPGTVPNFHTTPAQRTYEVRLHWQLKYMDRTREVRSASDLVVKAALRPPEGIGEDGEDLPPSYEETYGDAGA